VKKRQILTAALFAAATLAGCGTPVNNSNVNTNSPDNRKTGSNERPANSQPAAGNTSADDTGASLSMATPTEAYKAAYHYRKNKDIQGLKKVLSKDILEFFEDIGKAENKSLDDELKEMTERPQANAPETRNEKITGNRAVLEYKDENGEWKTMDFEKEGSDWKLTAPKADPPPDKPGPKKP
jgi:hypothetical protein